MPCDVSRLMERRLASLKKGNRDAPNDEELSHRTQDDDGPYIRSREEVRLSDSPAAPIAAETNVASGISPLKIASSTKAISLSDVPMASHLSTTFTDDVDHQINSIAEVLSNSTFPNKFRVKARVKSIHTRGLPGKDSFVQRYCSHCKRG